MVAQDDVRLLIIIGTILLHVLWLGLRCIMDPGSPASDVAEEMRRSLERAQAQVWLLVIRIGFSANACLALILLLLLSVDTQEKTEKYTRASLAFGSIWSFCALYLLLDRLDRRRRGALLVPQDALRAGPLRDAGSGPRHRPSAHSVLMMLFAVLGIVHPSPFQGLLLHVQRAIFNIASLNALEAAVLNTIASGARLSNCLRDRQREEDDGGCGDSRMDLFFAEVCFFLGPVLATNAAREICKIAMYPVDARSPVVKSSSSDMSEEADITASNEALALCSILHTKYDAVVFLDVHHRIVRPATALAMMLGLRGSLYQWSLIGLMPGDHPETTTFLTALDALEPTSSPRMAAATRISMINAEGALVTMQCTYAALADKDGNAPGGYVLGMQEVVTDPAPKMRASRSQIATSRSSKDPTASRTGKLTSSTSIESQATLYGRSQDETLESGTVLSRTGSMARRGESGAGVMAAHLGVMSSISGTSRIAHAGHPLHGASIGGSSSQGAARHGTRASNLSGGLTAQASTQSARRPSERMR